MASKTERRNDGVLTAIAGATRSGKTLGLRQSIGHEPRALVWDPRGEWRDQPGFTTAETPRELGRLLGRCARKCLRLAYFGPVEHFDIWCVAAYKWAQAWPVAIAVDEVADVSHAGKAVGPLGTLIRQGLYYGPHVYVATQRPQETSTSLWGNASVVRCYWQPRPGDREYMARQMGIDVSRLEQIPRPQPGRAPEYVEVTIGTGEPVAGRLRI